jgi:hypothetical protein
MRVADVPGTEVLVLAFSYAIVTIIGSLVLTMHFEYRFRGFLAATWRAYWESTFAAFVGGLGAYVTLSLFSPVVSTTTTLKVFLLGLGGGSVGIIATMLAYAALGSREYKETLASVRARLWRRADTGADVTLVTSAEETQST